MKKNLINFLKEEFQSESFEIVSLDESFGSADVRFNEDEISYVFTYNGVYWKQYFHLPTVGSAEYFRDLCVKHEITIPATREV
jgi:hypothetical protein